MKMPAQPGPVTANAACFAAMFIWAFSFPAAEVLLDSWGAVSLQAIRIALGVGFLMLFWWLADGTRAVMTAPWRRGLMIGGVGFGIGSVALVIGQKMSDAVTPAIAVAMMPVAGAALEVMLDKRRLRPYLVLAITLALIGGYLAAGVRFAGSTFGFGALICMVSVMIFAWGTRATTREFPSLTPIGQTSITFAGSMVFSLIAYGLAAFMGLGETDIGLVDTEHLVLLLIMSIPATAFAQLLWIWSVGGLGILFASLHMNAVPFYVMAIVAVMLDGSWNWDQALGAALVGTGVLVAQLGGRSNRAMNPES